MAISRRAKFVRWLTGRYMDKLDVPNVPVAEAREHLEVASRMFSRRAHGVETRPAKLAGVEVDWLHPQESRKDKIVYYLHGGAYVLGSRSTHRKLAGHIAKAAGVVAVVPEYRLAPEHPFPAGIEDAVVVYKALLESGIAPGDIVIAGDSAGGGLTVATLLSLRHEGVPMPAAAVLLSPFLDVTGSGESMKTRVGKDPWFDPNDIHVVARYYCPDENEWTNPLVSPVFANVAGLPPMLIQVGDDEILLSDSTRFAEHLREQGVEVELEVFPDLWHVFQLFVGKMPESRAAIVKIGQFIRSLWQDS